MTGKNKTKLRGFVHARHYLTGMKKSWILSFSNKIHKLTNAMFNKLIICTTASVSLGALTIIQPAPWLGWGLLAPHPLSHRDPGLCTCKWARRTFDSAQDHQSRDLCVLFAVQRRWRAPHHIEACMNRMARERAFQQNLIRACRPWRCWNRPVWPNRGELCAERGELYADSLKLIPVVCSSFF